MERLRLLIQIDLVRSRYVSSVGVCTLTSLSMSALLIVSSLHLLIRPRDADACLALEPLLCLEVEGDVACEEEASTVSSSGIVGRAGGSLLSSKDDRLCKAIRGGP